MDNEAKETKTRNCYKPEVGGNCAYFTVVGKDGFEDGEPIEKCKRCKHCEFSYQKTK